MTAVLLSVIVGAGPVALAGEHLVHSRTHEEIKPVLEFVRDHWRPGDTLYVHYGAQYALLYYEECGCLQLAKPHTTQDLWPLRPLRGENGQFDQAAAPLAPDVILGRYFGLNAGQYVNDLKRIRGRRRVWFLYSHVNDEGDLKIVQQSLLRYMRSNGRRIEEIDRPGVHAYLYRMRR
jgi:hypothetical protein